MGVLYQRAVFIYDILFTLPQLRSLYHNTSVLPQPSQKWWRCLQHSGHFS